MTDELHTSGPSSGTSRRAFLLGGAAAGAGVAATIATARLVAPSSEDPATIPLNGPRVVPFYGPHQAGVTAVPGAVISYLSLSLAANITRDDVRAWLMLLSDDAARLTQGSAALADQEREIASSPAGLVITLGVGPELVRRVDAASPSWLRPLPTFAVDRLEPRFSGADLLLVLQGDDQIAVAHAARLLLRDSRAFATLAWRQDGFRHANGVKAPGSTMRNLFGQLDGTSNFGPGSTDFDAAVWARPDAPAWLQGGTSLVLRRIAMDLEGWDEVGREGRGEVVGRRVDTGAPLTGSEEHDVPDLHTKNPHGLSIINPASHVARARAGTPESSIVRMAYNYDDMPEIEGQISNVGLLFASWQADVDKQFVPIQARLAEADLLNTWTTPIGSTVVAIPPGCEPGGFIGETLF